MRRHGVMAVMSLLVALVLSTIQNPIFAKKPPRPPRNELIPLKVILLAGQSNMSGWGTNSDLATLAPDLQQPQTDVRIWHKGSWKDLQPGLGGNPDQFGPELVFGRDMADAFPTDNIALIKAGSAGNDLALNWDPDTPGDSWIVFLENVYSALAALDSTVYKPEIVGMIWAQGERDAQFEEQALAYEQNMTNFIQAVRTEFGKPNLPFVFALSPATVLLSGSTLPYITEVREAQLNVWLNVPNTGLVFADDLTGWEDSPVHFDSAGQLEFGARFVTEMLVLAIPVDVESVSYATSGGIRRHQESHSDGRYW